MSSEQPPARVCAARGESDHDWKSIALGVCWCQECGIVSFTAGGRLVPRRAQMTAATPIPPLVDGLRKVGTCAKCGAEIQVGYAYCPTCHAKEMERVHARENMPVGGTSSPPEFEAEVPKSGCGRPAYMPGRGSASPARVVPGGDDNPSQQNALRVMEDQP